MGKYYEIKRRAYEANMEIAPQNLPLYSFGNASCCDRQEGVYAIKPSGVPYKDLTAEMMVIVDFENKVVEGQLRSSSDTKTHSVLYQNFQTIGAICHTHSPYAVAWAQALKPIPILGTTHADHMIHSIPVTKVLSAEAVKRDYEAETGNQIVKTFKDLDPQEVEMVLVARHGPFAWGKDSATAIYNSKVLEEIAKIAVLTLTINPETPELKEVLKEKHYYRKHGKNAYYGQKKAD